MPYTFFFLLCQCLENNLRKKKRKLRPLKHKHLIAEYLAIDQQEQQLTNRGTPVTITAERTRTPILHPSQEHCSASYLKFRKGAVITWSHIQVLRPFDSITCGFIHTLQYSVYIALKKQTILGMISTTALRCLLSVNVPHCLINSKAFGSDTSSCMPSRADISAIS